MYSYSHSNTLLLCVFVFAFVFMEKIGIRIRIRILIKCIRPMPGSDAVSRGRLACVFEKDGRMLSYGIKKRCS